MSTLNCENGIDPVGLNVQNTGNNATFGIQTEVITNAGYTIYSNLASFVVHNGNIISITDGLYLYQSQFISATIWGDDVTTDELDGVPSGGELEFYFLNGSDVYQINGLPKTDYEQNFIYVLNNETANSVTIDYYCSLLLTDFETLDSVNLLQEIQTLQSDLNFLTDDYEILEGAYQSLTSQLSESSLTISSLEETISNLNSELQQQQGLNNVNLQLISELTQLRDNLLNQISVLETANTTLLAAQNSNSSTINQLNQQIDEYIDGTGIDSPTSDNQDEIDALLQELSELTTSNSQIQTIIDAFNAQPVVIYEEPKSRANKISNETILYGAIGLAVIILARKK